jgi:deoxyribodipyrimidine photo-lyase
MSTALVWLRRDLRLADNPALANALAAHSRVLAVYLHAPHEEGDWAPGGASRWWLHHALADLQEQLGGRLWIGEGDSLSLLQSLIDTWTVGAVYWNRRYEPAAAARDAQIKQVLREQGRTVTSSNGSLLFEPWEIETLQDEPFKMFTPFWRTCLSAGLPGPLAEAPALERLVTVPGGLQPADLGLLPKIRWDRGLTETWRPTRAEALERMRGFIANGLPTYAQGRDLPAQEGVSGLAAWLHFGQLGVRELARACAPLGGLADAFLRQLGWRDFAHHLLYHFPHTVDRPLNPRFASMPWRNNRRQLRAWQQGRTGIPLVDAGMRQLWHTGSMHNRVRMLAASFLTKNLLLPWQSGTTWFWDTLVDADLANNTLGWQWCAGSGADAAPYFRIFNPASQGQKFDPQGEYVRRWVPELARLEARWIHRPWEAPSGALHDAGVRLGEHYPRPLVDLKATRERALAAWHGMRSA